MRRLTDLVDGMAADSTTLQVLYSLDTKQERVKNTKLRALRPVQSVNHSILEGGGTQRRKVMLV
jgi:hypothetical protein